MRVLKQGKGSLQQNYRKGYVEYIHYNHTQLLMHDFKNLAFGNKITKTIFACNASLLLLYERGLALTH